MRKINLQSKANCLVLACLCCSLGTALWAQGVKISTTPGNPDASAVLDAEASNKGVLVPRVDLQNTTDGVTVANPATGLMVFNTGQTLAPAGFYYNAGTPQNPAWVLMLPNPAHTDLDMALFNIVNLATPVNPNDAVNKNYVDQAVVSGSGGGSPSVTMLSSESQTAENLGNAARACANLTEGGHSDWFLPSLDELMYILSIDAGNISQNSSGNLLWTRTPSATSTSRSMTFRFSDGYMTSEYGYNSAYFRCVR